MSIKSGGHEPDWGKMNQPRECDCGLKEELDKIKQEKEKECQNKLHECQKSSREKDRQMNDLKKKHTLLLVIIVIVATILGKETIDGITEWIESLNSLKTGVEQFTSQADESEDLEWTRPRVAPGPAALCLFAIAGASGARRRRR